MKRYIDEDGRRTRVYRNNVTRPGLVYRGDDPRDFLIRNYVEVVNLIQCHCEYAGLSKEDGEDFRGFFWDTYISGANNYDPRKGDISKFLYNAVFYAMGNYRGLMETSSRQVPVGLRVGVGRVVEVEGEYNVCHELYLFEKLIEVGSSMERVYKMLVKGLTLSEIARKMGLSPSTVNEHMGKLRGLYRRWVERSLCL